MIYYAANGLTLKALKTLLIRQFYHQTNGFVCVEQQLLKKNHHK